MEQNVITSNEILSDLKKLVKELPSDKIEKGDAEKILENTKISIDILDYITDYLNLAIDILENQEEIIHGKN